MDKTHTVDKTQAAPVDKSPKPSIGRIVHYRDEQSVIQAAIITAVHTELCVNLTVFPSDALPGHKTSLMRGDEHNQWNWPPRV